MDFQNKVIVITGAGSGMGKATAEYFAKKTTYLVLIDKNEDNLNAVALRCKNNSESKILTHITDITKDSEVKKAIDATIKEFKRIDVLVNSAGIYGPSAILHSDIMDVYDRVMAVNLRAIVLLTNLSVPHLIESKGCIINISSISSTCVTDNCLPYNISKAALTHFTKCIALELASKGVRVNVVEPGPVETDMLINSGMSKEDSDNFWKETAKGTPLKSVSQPEEIAELIGYLASDKSRSITGANFVIDNGLLLLGTQTVPDAAK